VVHRRPPGILASAPVAREQSRSSHRNSRRIRRPSYKRRISGLPLRYPYIVARFLVSNSYAAPCRFGARPRPAGNRTTARKEKEDVT
jgi:hypothetical protein